MAMVSFRYSSMRIYEGVIYLSMRIYEACRDQAPAGARPARVGLQGAVRQDPAPDPGVARQERGLRVPHSRQPRLAAADRVASSRVSATLRIGRRAPRRRVDALPGRALTRSRCPGGAER